MPESVLDKTRILIAKKMLGIEPVRLSVSTSNCANLIYFFFLLFHIYILILNFFFTPLSCLMNGLKGAIAFAINVEAWTVSVLGIALPLRTHCPTPLIRYAAVAIPSMYYWRSRALGSSGHFSILCNSLIMATEGISCIRVVAGLHHECRYLDVIR
ncbi:hypothetical protein F5Y05DRAFT_184136 [Hypoxylon sp. FL0543]|nr:hypothetical protein F5Y05DRAFT_184136 [Hypoxylon sp. FL0543]